MCHLWRYFDGWNPAAPGPKVRRLSAGGNRIRTVGPAEGTRRPRGFVCRSSRVFRWRGIERRRHEPPSNLAVSSGTDGSNPASFSESANFRSRSIARSPSNGIERVALLEIATKPTGKGGVHEAK